MSRLKRIALAILVLVTVLCYSQVTRAEAHATVTVTDIRYSSTIQYNVSAKVGATLSYQDTLPGHYLAMGVVDMDTLESVRGISWQGDINQLRAWVQLYPAVLVSGDATATPLNCGEGQRPIRYRGRAFCSTQLRQTYPLSPSGSWDVEFTLTNLTPGTRHLGIIGLLYVAETAPAAATPPVSGDFKSFVITVVATTLTVSTVSTTAQTSTLTTVYPTTTTMTVTTTEQPSTTVSTQQTPWTQFWEGIWQQVRKFLCDVLGLCQS